MGMSKNKSEIPATAREYQRQYRIRMKNAGACKCGRPKTQNRMRCGACIESGRKTSAIRNKKRKMLDVCRHCGVVCGRSKCDKCRERARASLARLKARVMTAYGARCVCCGECDTRFLTIDHIDETGASHRKQIPGGSLYRWLEKNNYPKNNYQILCFNCNCGKHHNGGVCPHKSKL